MPIFDYVIVGAGTGGCLVAKHLLDRGAQVLLIESGPDARANERVVRPAEYLRLQQSEIDWSFKTEPSYQLANRVLEMPRGRSVGGCSAINAMIYNEGVAEDFQVWETALGPDWSPPVIEKLLQTQRQFLESNQLIESPREITRACRLFLDAAQLSVVKGCLRGEFAPFLRTNRNGRRTTTADLILRARGESQHSQLTVRKQDTVRKLRFRHEKVVGVELKGGIDVEAKRGVVLCCGSIGTPHLLMVSGIGPRNVLAEAGIRCDMDIAHVGANLKDHLVFPVIFQLKREAPFPGAWCMRDLARWHFLGGGPISSNLAEVGGFCSANESDTDHRTIGIHVTPTHYLRYPNHSPDAFLTLAVHVAHPLSRGSVRVLSKDIGRAPLIDPAYLSNSKDLELTVDAIQQARRIASESPLRDHIEKEALPGAKRDDLQRLTQSISRYAMTLYHPIGTCRMGTDSGSVVDENFRVRGIDNLYVADASVFPDIPRANPAACVMLVARRAAEFIK